MEDSRRRLQDLYMKGWLAGAQREGLPADANEPGSAVIAAGWEAGALDRTHAEIQALSTIDWALALLAGFEREMRGNTHAPEEEIDPWKSTN